MIISATIKCQWCEAVFTIPEKKTTRAFNIALNKLKRHHDWGCETRGKARQKVEADTEVAILVTGEAIARMISVEE